MIPNVSHIYRLASNSKKDGQSAEQRVRRLRQERNRMEERRCFDTWFIVWKRKERKGRRRGEEREFITILY